MKRWRPDPYSVVIVAVSAVVHLVQLGRRPLAHDEAIDAFFSWQAHTEGFVKYDPVYHGPLRFYIEGFILGNFGTGPGWARLLAAVSGIVATAVIVSQRRLLGTFGARAAAVLFVVSPTILTVTRTGREDSLTGLVTLGLLLVIANSLREPRPRHVIGAGVLLALTFTLKETVFIVGFAGVCWFVGLGVVALRRREGAAAGFYRSLKALGSQPWMWSTVAFVAITSVVFTGLFQDWSGFASGMIDGIKYWLSQHEVGRGSQEWFFYIAVYVGYEWLLLGVGAIGAIVALRRRDLVGLWFLSMAVVQFAVYSWAGEKFAWLALHPLIPAVLLAGLGAEAMRSRLLARSRTWRSASVVIAAALVVATFVIAVPPAITDGADTAELLVTVQTTESVRELVDRLDEARRDDRLGGILVDGRDSGSWPWAWYLQGWDDVGWVELDPTVALPPGYDAYIVSAITDPPAVPEGYVIERYPFRGWWLPDYGAMTISDAARWFFTRRTWSGQGTTDQYVIVRADSEVLAQPLADD